MSRGSRLRTEDWSELRAIFLSSSIINFVILPNTSSVSGAEIPPSVRVVLAEDDEDDDEEEENEAGGDEEGIGVDGNEDDEDAGWFR